MTKKKEQANGPTAGQEMRLLIERWERLQEEKEAIAADQKDVMAEAKSRGFDVKTLRDIIRLRKMKPEERREREALLDTYKAALGMLDGTPLGRWALERLSKEDEEPSEAEQPVDDAQYEAAKTIVVEKRNASASFLQRQLRVGYNTASRFIERMEAEGIVGRPDHAGRREVLAPAPEGSEPVEAPAPQPEPTVEDARAMGAEAARAKQPVTANPFPARDPRRAAWDEAWCAELGTDGMEIPDALKPSAKPKKGDGGDSAPGAGGEQ